MNTDVFDGLVSTAASTQNVFVFVLRVLVPRLDRRAVAQSSEREERIVSVGHVEVLCAEEEASHELHIRVTVDDHCATIRTATHHQGIIYPSHRGFSP